MSEGRRAPFSVRAASRTILALVILAGSSALSGAALSSVSVSPASVPGGTTAIGTVTLAANAGAGESVNLSSNNPAAVVPSSVPVPQGTSSATFTITTTAGANANAVITATKASVNKTTTLNVYTPVAPPATELTEGNASSWTSFSTVDMAPTSVNDDSSVVKVGTYSIRFDTQSGFDTGIKYPATPSLHWDLTGVHFLVFWANLVSVNGDLWEEPVVVLNSPNGTMTYTPTETAMVAGGGWKVYQMPLEGNSFWQRVDSGTPTLSDVTQIELHQDTWGAGFTTYYDGMQFVAAIPPDYAEGNASAWGTFAPVDGAATSVVNDLSFVRAGSQSIRFDTASGFDTGVVYPAAGNAHWDLSHKESIFFWAYALNTNDGGFQGYQPVVVLKCQGGDVIYTPQDSEMAIGAWTLYQIPLIGNAHWVTSFDGAPTLTDVNQIEIHQDTWGSGFTVYYDGLNFGGPPPSLTFSRYDITGGTPVTATVTLAEPAPPGGLQVDLSSDTPSVASVPDSIVVPAGAMSATFTITTSVLVDDFIVMISTSYGDALQSIPLQVWAAPAGVTLSSLSVSPTSVIGGNNATGTVTLSSPAPIHGVDVALTSSLTTAATVPPSAHIAEGATSGTFTVTTIGVASTKSVTLTGVVAGGTPKTTTLSVTAAGISSVTVNPPSVAGGAPSTGTITLNGQAPPGGASVGVTSGNTSVATIPVSPIVVPAGATTATFAINTLMVATDTNVTITGNYKSVNKSATLTVTAGGLLISSVTFSPASVIGSTSSTGTVTLNGPAPSGATVLLSSDTPAAATVPPNVVIAANASSATFTVTTFPVATNATVTVTATYNGTRTGTLTVNAAVLNSVSVSPATVPGEAPVTGTATLSGPAPTGGAQVTISSNNGAATVPPNVTVAANATSATFPVTTLPVATNQTVTITGTYLGTKNATLTVTTGIQSVSLNPASVQGGSPSTGTVTLTGPATTGGAQINLTSSNPSAATVPATITIAQGATSGTFTVTTIAGQSANVTITAAYGGMSKNATLAVIGAASKLAFGTQPSGITGGGVITPAVTVRILDAAGNLTNSTANVTVAIGTNPGGGTLSGTLTVAAVAGVATFSNLSINKIGTGYTLTAASSGLTGATSSAFNVTLGAASRVAFSVQPSNVTAGGFFSPSVVVQIQDAGGNLVNSTASITVALGANPGGSTLSGTLTRAAIAGSATFGNLSLNKVGTGYTLTAASTGLTGATSATFNVTAGAANKLAFGQQPATATGGGTIAPAVTVQVQDANGNPTTSTAWVVVAIGTNPSGGKLSGTRSLAAVAGVATFSGLSIDKVGTGYTLTAASLGLTGATSSAFNITVGAAAKLAWGVQPTSVAAAAAIAPAVTVRILDAGGNLTTSTASVVVAIGTNPGGGTLSGTKTRAAVAGTATFSGLSINLAGNGYTLAATSGSLTSATSTPFNIGGATKIRVETAADGSGVVVPAQNVSPGGSVTVYSISRDTNNAFVANAAVDGWTLAGVTGGVAAGDLAPIAAITEYTIPTAVSYPASMTTAADGNIWFAENHVNKLAKITPAGVITEITSVNLNNDVWDMAAGPDGNLWYTEPTTNKIARVTLAGVLTEFTVPTANSYPMGIAVGSDGNLWFVEDNVNKIGRITTSGLFAEFTIPTANSSPIDIDAGSDGNLWFTESATNKIGRITPVGVVTEFTIPTTGSGVDFIAAGPDGNLWFTEYSASKIGRVTTSGVFTEFPSVVQHPDEITAGADGNLWFTSTYPAQKLARITTAGAVSSWAVTEPVAVVAGPDGAIWFAEGGDFANKIARFGSKSATFTGHVAGAGAIHAAKTSLVSTDSGVLTVVSGTPTKLVFGTQPSTVAAGAPITPAVTVQIQDANGNVTTSTASVTIALGTNPAGGTLSGTLTQAAVNGVATFANLSIDRLGTGYTLTAASTGLTGATSTAFNVTAAPATRLVFGIQPTSVPKGAVIAPPVTVQILDAIGNLTTSTASVTVAIGTNPSGGVLAGTKTVAAVAGVATFSTLSIDKAGTGYTLTASSSGLTGATSTPFDIGAATKILVETKADGTGVVVPAQSIASGASLSVYAIGRDSSNAFVANVTPDSWSLTGVTGGVAATDLAAAGYFSNVLNLIGAPAGIASGPDGNIWVTEGTGKKIARITPAGLLTEFTLGASPGAITAGPDGNLWFAEGAGRITRMTPAGVVADFATPSNSSVGAIVAGPDGNLWFTENSVGRIGKITPAGVVTEYSLPNGGVQPYGIAAGSDGALWFTEYGGNKVGRITTSGGVTEFPIPTSASQPALMAAGSDGNLWFTEYAASKIGKITTAGVITEYSIPSAGSYPLGIVSGPDGALWFGETGANKIGRISTAGSFAEYGPASANVTAIASGPDQNIWFTGSSGPVGRVGTSAANPGGKATFTGHKPGTASIHVSKYGMTSTDSGVLTVPAGAATRLAFGVQPAGAVAGAAFSPAITVQIQDANGNVVNSTASVTVAIGTNPGGGTLAGTKTLAAVAGTATFSTLSINKVGVGYTLSATSTGLTAATSAAFDIRAGTATKLVVETKADGSGTAVAAQSVAVSSTLTAWAISRDANNNFVGNVVPDSWSLTSKTGGVVDGDLIASPGFAEFPLAYYPVAITPGLDGNVWFSEIAGNGSTDIHVGVSDPAGNVYEPLALSCNVTDCPYPAGIGAALDGTLWFTSGNYIYRFNAGFFPVNWDSTAIARGPDGNMWVTEYKNDSLGHGDSIARMALNGTRTEFPLPAQGGGAESIVSGPDNNLWFTEYVRGQIGRITPSGTITEFPIGGSAQPLTIAPAPDGNLWFTESAASKIGRMSTAGVLGEFPLITGFFNPKGIVAGSDGNLWITGGSKIGRMTPAGVLSVFAPPTSATSLSGIVASADGNLWFTESGPPNKLGRLDPLIGSATLTGHVAGSAVISATKAGLTSTNSGIVTVAAAAATLTLPATVNGVSPVTGTVTLSAPAPAGGTAVTLSSSNTNLATVTPASVTVAAGQTTKTFTVTPKRVYATSYVTIKAIISSIAYTAKVTLTPGPLLSTLTLTPLAVTGNSGSSTGTVGFSATLSSPLTVTLSSSLPSVIIPPTVTVPANASSAPFDISIPDLTGFTTATITATSGSALKQAVLTVLVPHITAPVADPGSYTYPGAAPVVFNGWAQTINNQPLEYRWVPYDPANAGVLSVVFPGPARAVMTPSTPQMRFVVTIAGTPQPSVMDAADACAGAVPGTCGWKAITLVPNRPCVPPITTEFPTISGLTDFVTGSPPSLSATQYQNGERYSWVLEQESPVGSGLYASVAVTQGGSPLNDGFDTANRVWTPKLAGNVQLPPGRYRLQVLVARPSGSCYSVNGYSGVYIFNVTSAGPNLLGLAPGMALAGASNMVLYGTGFDATMSVSVAGPVYNLSDTTFSNPLCDLSTGTCPQAIQPASLGSSSLAFALPSSLSGGYYLVRSRTTSGTLSTGGKWLQVNVPSKTVPVVPPNQHNMANFILPGQTITGTFVQGGDTTGAFGDYNTYFFYGTAGTVINASVSRVDTSKPWEDPSELDPQIEIIAPDGLVYDNLWKADDHPGLDYDASLSGAVLPLTGVYYLRAETLKGSGAYRASLSFTTVAAAPSGSRAIPFFGNYNTAAVNANMNTATVFLDPRGYPISGANVNFTVTPASGDTGTVTFVTPPSLPTQFDGSAFVTLKVSAQGKVQITPALTDTILAQWIVVKPESSQPVTRYVAAGHLDIRPYELDHNRVLWFDQGPHEKLPVFRPAPPSEAAQTGQSAFGPAKSRMPGAKIGGGASSGGPSVGPGPQATAPVPIAVSTRAARGPQAIDTITSCGGTLFVEAGANAGVQPPFTMTLTDETPPTGGTLPNGLVDSTGIHGHRVQKTIRMKIDIKDATGNAPNGPVLVHLGVVGSAHGTLILDPDGNRVQCSQASFLWHERNAQNQIIALNEEFEYTLGTLGLPAGFIPDTNNPGHMAPVWATTEILGMTVSTVNQSGTTTQLTQTFKVHPEPSKPTHFSTEYPDPPAGTPDRTFTIWPDYHAGQLGTRSDGQPKLGETVYGYSMHWLYDANGNPVFGYTGLVQPAPPATNLTVGFLDQTTGSTLDGEAINPQAYTMRLDWTNDPVNPPKQMPSGPYSTTIKVNYPTDPEWPSGSVSKSVSLQFDRGTFHFVEYFSNWDCQYMGSPPYSCMAYDPSGPWVVSPGAEGDALPQSWDDADPLVRKYHVDAARANFIIGTGPAVDWLVPFNYTTTYPETSDSPAFKISLVDSDGKVADDAVFQVLLCPRYDHFAPNGNQRPCTNAPVQSVGGIVNSVRVNANGANNGDAQAMMGVQILHAPSKPGDYFAYLETLEGKQYRIRQQSRFSLDGSPAGEFKGGFWLLTVSGVEILDTNFQPVDPMSITTSTPAYVRLISANETSSNVQRHIRIEREDGAVVTPDVTITFIRQGTSTTYLASVTLVPQDPNQSLQMIRQRSAAAVPELTIGLGSNEAVVSTLDGNTNGTCGVDYKALLRFRFLKRDGSGLTPYPGDSSRDGELQETELGESVDQYPEIVNLEIQAIDRNHPTVICNCSETVGLAELQNTKYKSPTDFFFQGLYGDTKLQSNGKINGNYVQLNAGRATVSLKSVLDSRLDHNTGLPTPATLPQNLPAYGDSAGANVKAVPKGSSRQVVADTSPQYIALWVDERSYGRQRGDPAGNQNWTIGGNNERDWIEKKARDFYATWVGNTEIETGMSRVTQHGETNSTTDDFTARTTPILSRTRAKVTWNLWRPGIRRLTTASDGFTVHHDEAGLRMDASVSTDPNKSDFAQDAIHEARHSWQYTGADSTGLTDGDHDFAFLASPSAPILLDARFGANPEYDFLGDSCVDLSMWGQQGFDLNENTGTAREVDAIRKSAALVDLAAGCLLPSSNYTLTVSETTTSLGRELWAKVTFKKRTGNPLPYEGAPIKFEVVPGAGGLTGNITLSERVEGIKVLADLVPACYSAMVDGASTAISRAHFHEGDKTQAEGRVLLKIPAQGATPTRVKISLMLPTECAPGLPSITTTRDISP